MRMNATCFRALGRGMLLLLAAIGAQLTFSASAQTTITPTFESMGIEWAPPVGVAGQAYATFAPVGSGATPTRSLDLVFDAAAGEYRGSLLFLEPDTQFDITLYVDGVATETAMAISFTLESCYIV